MVGLVRLISVRLMRRILRFIRSRLRWRVVGWARLIAGRLGWRVL